MWYIGLTTFEAALVMVEQAPFGVGECGSGSDTKVLLFPEEGVFPTVVAVVFVFLGCMDLSFDYDL